VAANVTVVPIQIELEGEAEMVTDAGTMGLTVTAKFAEGVPLPQLLTGVAEIFPPELPKITVTLLVLALPEMLAPAGKLQV
jgi:hypothetical protein